MLRKEKSLPKGTRKATSEKHYAYSLNQNIENVKFNLIERR